MQSPLEKVAGYPGFFLGAQGAACNPLALAAPLAGHAGKARLPAKPYRSLRKETHPTPTTAFCRRKCLFKSSRDFRDFYSGSRAIGRLYMYMYSKLASGEGDGDGPGPKVPAEFRIPPFQN